MRLDAPEHDASQWCVETRPTTGFENAQKKPGDQNVMPGFEVAVCYVANLSRVDLVDSADAEYWLSESVELDVVEFSGHPNDCAVVSRFKLDVTAERDVSTKLVRGCWSVVVGQVPCLV